MTIDRFGNTSSASIPMALKEALKDGRIKEDHTIVLVGFGGGLTWEPLRFAGEDKLYLTMMYKGELFYNEKE